MPKTKTLRQDISEILVKWNMPTRQAAISQIEQAVRQLIERAKPEIPNRTIIDDYWSGYEESADQYHSSLLEAINGTDDTDRT